MPNIRHYVVRILSVVIIYTLLGQSIFAAAPDAPAAIVGGVSDFGAKITQAWKSMEVSQYYDIKVPAIFTTFTRSKAKNKPKADTQFDRIEIGQRDKTVVQGESIDFVATAYRGEQSVGGVAFRWSIRKAESGESRPLSNGRFRANVPGRYILQVSSGAFTEETNVTVLPDPAFAVSRILRKPERERTPADLKLIEEWNATGVLRSHAISSRDRQPTVEVNKAKRAKAKSTNGDANRINSVDPIGWDNGSYATADDPVNFVGRPIGAASEKGAANGNYNLTIPAVNLDGRGDLGINLNLEYNSRLWSISGTEMTYNADSGYPAPGWNLGYGKIFYTGTAGGCMFVSPDGTRRSYGGSSSYYSSGSVTSDTFTGYTTDGSMIEYGCQYYNNSSTSYTTVTGWAQLPNGTTMTFNSPSSNFDMTFPTRIVDRHGNYIDITYEGGYGPAIDTIVDTLGRTIDFNYNGTALRSISGPGYNGATRTFIRFEYFHQTIGTSGMFGSPITATNVANTTPYQLKAIFYPTTTNGYWFCGTSYYSPCGTDAYSPYGIIRTVLEQRGMNWNSGPDTIDWGTTNRSRVYNFPTSASTSYTDSPGYSTQVETFDGIDQGSPLTTSYSKSTSGSYETITVTRPDTSKLIQVSNISDGLQVENRIENSSSTVLDKVVTTLGSGGSGDFYSPRPTSIEHTDDKGQVTKTDFTYGTSVYNQVTVQKEYDYPGTSLYREKRYTYENGSSYTNRNIFSLVKSQSVYDASNNRLSLTEYNYDQSAPIGIPDTGGDAIVHLLSNYNPDTSSTTEVCVAYNNYQCTYEGETFYNGEEYVYCECTDYDDVSVYDYLTQYRGNVTEVITYADADASPSGAIDYDYTYDAAGNQRTTTTNCCQQIGSDYTVNTQYSMPASMTKGSSNPMSSERITQSYTYDANTKIPTAITDFNGVSTTIAYDAVSRPTLVTLNSGGKKTTTYTDSSNYVTEHVQKADNTTVSQSINYFNGRGQVNKTTYQAGSSNWNGTQIKYDEMGRRWKVSRPYDTGSSPSYWSEITYDKLSRPLSQIAPDGSTSTLSYNASAPSSAYSNDGQTVTSADAWGRERWVRYDAFGRLVEAVEPNPTGSDGDVNNTNNIRTLYNYDQLDRLTSIVQDAQTRSFAYDSLGRMTYQKVPEQDAHFDAAGAYDSIYSLVWSEKFEYDARSNLTKRTDARGVVTTYDYQLSGSPDPLNRLQSITYSKLGNADTTHTIHTAPTVTFDYMTTGDKTRVKKVTTSGVSVEENTFDSEGRTASYELTLDSQPTKPFKIDYSYDTAHRLTQIDYPKKYQMSSESRAAVVPSYDQASRLTQLAVDSSNYLSDVSYNTSSQVTSLKTGAATSYPRVESYSYEAATGLLTGQTVKDSSLTTSYLDLTYQYTRNGSAGTSISSEKTGQLTKIEDNLNHNRDRKYQFDALGRLNYAKGGTAAGASSVTANWTQTYSYDKYGNRTGVSVSGVDQSSASVPSDGITSLTATASTNRLSGYTYDRAGNVTRGQKDGSTWLKFEYDEAGRVKKVKTDGGADLETYSYGANRQKLIMYDGTNTFYYVWGGSSIIAEYMLSTTPLWLKSYIYSGSRLLLTISRVTSSTETKETHHPDRLGTKLITDVGAGTSYQQSTLPFGTAFGGESTGSGTNQVFTSYDRSAGTGLDYAWNRLYSSGQSRFTQVDPIGMDSVSIGDPQSNNLYGYTLNMPTDFVDPTGLMPRYFDVYMGMGCSPGYDGKWHCTEQISRYWYDDGVDYGFADNGGVGGGGGGGTTLGAAVDLAKQLLKSKACRKAVAGQKGANSDVAGALGSAFASGHLTMRSDVLRGGKSESVRPFNSNASATTTHFNGKPVHISFNKNAMPFTASEDDRFQAVEGLGDFSKLDAMAAQVLHEFRHWSGDRNSAPGHTKLFNTEIYLFCYLLNPNWTGRLQEIND